MRSDRSKTALGALLWLAAAAGIIALLAAAPPEGRARLVSTVLDTARLATHGPAPIDIAFDRSVELYAGDGVFVRDGDELIRIGELRTSGTDGRAFTAVVDPASSPDRLPHAAAITASASLGWVVEALLPASTRRRIEAEWDEFRRTNAQLLLAAVIPLLHETVTDVSILLRGEIDRALRAHRQELRDLADEYGREILIDAVLPLVIDQIWPIVLRHGSAPLEQVGRQLWQAAPLFGFAWRGLYDQMPLTSSRLVEERWRQFLAEDAGPILEQQRPVLEQAFADMLRDIVANPEVRRTMQDSLLSLRDDSRLRDLLKAVAGEVATSPRLLQYAQQRLADPRVTFVWRGLRSEFDDLNRRLVKIIVFDDDLYHISPHFARFLRTMVLKKDWRFVLLAADPAALPPPQDAARGRVHQPTGGGR